MQVNVINETIRDNMIVIFGTAFVVLLCVCVVLLMIKYIIDAVATYHRNKDGGITGEVDQTDDEVYGGKPWNRAKGNDAVINDGARIAKKISDINSMYDVYNREVTQYAREVQRAEPEDIMDRRIIDSTYDDFGSGTPPYAAVRHQR